MEKQVLVEFGHMGTMLFKVAETYPSLLRTIGENVQNSLDMKATRIWIVVNLKTRNMSVRDNGIGVSENEFNESLRNVGVSQKASDKLGRFGLGLMSNLNKGSSFTFTSAKKGDPKGFLEWKFMADKIRQMAEISIPMRSRKDLSSGSDRHVPGTTVVEWRTEIFLHGLTDNTLLNRLTLDMLSEHIISQYNRVLKTSGAKIHVRFTDDKGNEQERELEHRSFTGTPVPEYHKISKDGAETLFQLFVAKPVGRRRNGKVQVGESGNPFRFSFTDFVSNSAEWLDEEAKKLLMSGVFEGEITNNLVTLHERRNSFVPNPALVHFCDSINQWCKNHGREIMEEVSDSESDDRLQRIGLETLSRIEALILGGKDTELAAVIRSFKRGTIGRGHTPTPKDELGEQDRFSLSVDNIAGREGNGSGHVGTDRKEPEVHRPNHTPLTVSGPRGIRRKIVRHHSFGLQLAYDMMPGCPDLWVLDEKTGELSINKRHPHFVRCLDKDEWLMALEEHIVLCALRVHGSPADWREPLKMMLDGLTGDVVFLITQPRKK